MGAPSASAKPTFKWDDALLFNDQLSEDERMVRDSARAYCQDKLMSRVLMAHRHEKFDRSVFNEMGEMGFLGPTIEGYGCAGVSYVCYGLIARELERVGIATVIMGCARDVVEHCGVPRLLFSDFPLGNGAGKPHDKDSQVQTLQLALQLLVQAKGPRTTWTSPQRWSEDLSWKLDYANPERMSPQELKAAWDEAEKVRIEARALREKTLTR